MTKNYTFLFFLLLLSNLSFSQTPCEDGKAGGYSCNQIDFMSRLDNNQLSGIQGVEGNDIWGWTDSSSGKEYVLMGQTNGTVFVDISNPLSPNIIGRLPSTTGNSSSWRDIKVYNDHAFIVADNNTGHGMQVFDLKRLRQVNNPIEVFDADAVYAGVSSAHNVVINEETGFAYIVGANGAGNGCGQGGLHIVDINDPKNPVFAGCFDQDGYTHDAQCVIYNGPDEDYKGQEVCFNANENTVTIANVDDKENTSLIAKSGYPQSAYSHQGWLTEDHQYFIANDELDERNFGVNTRTLIWDVRDLDNPVLLNQYYSEDPSIDHNLYVKDELVYQSNYTSGLVVMDTDRISDGEIRERAFFDTYPASNSANFNGAWSNYPFFESGIIAVSDINNGLFLLKMSLQNLITQHPLVKVEEEEVKINVLVKGDIEVDSYQWQKIEDGDISNLSSGQIYSGTDTNELVINSANSRLINAKFRCKIFLSDGNMATTFMSESLGSDINLSNDKIDGKNVDIYPNPVADMLNINSNHFDFESYKVVNVSGKTVFEKIVSNSSAQQIEVTNWENGVYFIVFKTKAGKVHLEKIMKK